MISCPGPTPKADSATCRAAVPLFTGNGVGDSKIMRRIPTRMPILPVETPDRNSEKESAAGARARPLRFLDRQNNAGRETREAEASRRTGARVSVTLEEPFLLTGEPYDCACDSAMATRSQSEIRRKNNSPHERTIPLRNERYSDQSSSEPASTFSGDTLSQRRVRDDSSTASKMH